MATITGKLNDLIKWADEIGDHDSLAGLRAETNRISGFVSSQGERQLLSALSEKVEQLEVLFKTLRESEPREEKKERQIEPARVTAERAPPQRDRLIVSDTNQFRERGRADPSVCTSCAAAFIKLLHQRAPLTQQTKRATLTQQTIRQSIDRGREAHESTKKALERRDNENVAGVEVVAHGGLGLRQIKATITRPRSKQHQIRDYETQIVGQLTDPTNAKNGIATAFLTKAGYSCAIAYDRNQREFILFDSHGEEATQNQAFIRVFSNGQELCTYLKDKLGFIDFPDVDYDVFTQQDNPNSFELTVVSSEEAPAIREALPARAPAQRRSCAQIARDAFRYITHPATLVAGVGMAAWYMLRSSST